MKLDEAERYVDSILMQLEPFIMRASAVGSVRRKEPEIGDLDILIETWRHDVKSIKNAVQRFSTLHSGGERKLRIGNVFGRNVQADIWMVYPPRSFPTMQAIFTGPDKVTIALRENLTRKGFQRPHGEIKTVSEEELFRFAGIPFVPPEERKNLNV